MSIETDANATDTPTHGTSGDEDAELLAAATKAWGEGPGGDDAEDDDAAEPAAEAPPKRKKPTPPKGEDEGDDDGEDDAEPAKAEPAAPAAKPKGKVRLAEFLEAQEREHRGRSDYERRQQELEAERRQLEADRKAAQEARQKAEETARRLREKPIETARELGIDPEQLMSGATRELSPEAKLYAHIHGLERQLHETRAQFEARIKADDERRQEDARRAHAAQTAHEERTFVAQAEQAAPSARLLYGSDRAILREAYEVIDACRARGLPTPSNDELLEYLEHKASREIARIRGQNSADPKAGAAPAPKTASGNPLSAKRASERRSPPPRYEDLSADEQDAELVRFAAKTMREARAKAAATRTTSAPGSSNDE